MNVAFEKLSDQARVWIYQSDRKLSDDEVRQIQEKGNQFSAQWSAHGKGLKSAVTILYHQFIILSVDETAHAASGCSIDSSVNFIKEIENTYDVKLLDRSLVAFLKGEDVTTTSFQKIAEEIHSGNIDKSTPTFNNTVQTKYDLKNNWLIPAEKSWLSRYFK
ncbi:MAG TPA: hypothetical protein DDY13_11600 [Cytophagales bacterium]|jgi:hypothetical protein|nr:hypothetical protein [Cytophagales bacterium]